MKAFLEHTLLLMQSLWYLAGIGFLLLLAVWFQQDVQSQRAAHARAEVRQEQLLFESRQALLDHQRTMERLSQPR